MPAFIALLLFASLGACQALPPVDPNPAAAVDAARALFAEAAQADQAGETQAALAAIQQAVALRPNHPTLLYNAAALEAQAGLTAQARLRLGKLARMGVGTDVRAQPAFASMHGGEAFERVADELARNAEPFGETPLHQVVTFGPTTLGQVTHTLPEGIAYDIAQDDWYVGGVNVPYIVRPRAKAVFRAHGRRGVFGMVFDQERRVIWAASAFPPGVSTEGDHAPPELMEYAVLGDWEGRSQLVRIRVDEQKDKAEFIVSHGPMLRAAGVSAVPVPGEQPSALGDVLVRANGEVLTSDAEGGTIWRVIDPDGWDSDREGPWLEQWLQGALLPSPQGMAEAAGFVYLADYSTGLHRFDDDGERRPLIKPEDLCDLGIDGLAAAGDQHLVAIQNGFAPQRILWLTLSADGTEITDWQVLAAGLPEWREPTLGLVHEGWFYFIANSHWPDFADFKNPQGEQSPPEIRKLELPL